MESCDPKVIFRSTRRLSNCFSFKDRLPKSLLSGLVYKFKYESKLSSQMSKALGKSIIRAYSTIACKVLVVGSEDNLSKDLDEGPFLNKALQKITCNLYYNFGEYLAPISVALITGKHYTEQKKKFSNYSKNSKFSQLVIPLKLLN